MFRLEWVRIVIHHGTPLRPLVASASRQSFRAARSSVARYSSLHSGEHHLCVGYVGA